MYALTEHIKCSVNVNQDKWLILLLKSAMFWLIFCLLVVLSMNERSLLNPLTTIMDLPISPSSSTREVSSAVILFAWKSTSSVQCGAKRLRPPPLSSGPLKMRVKSIANVSPGCWTPLYQKHKTSWEHTEEAPIQFKELSNVHCDDNWGERHSLKKERTMRATFKWREEEEGRYIIGGKIEACGVTLAQGEDV